MARSTSRTATSRCYAGIPSSVSTSVSFLSTLQSCVRCSFGQAWKKQNLPTVALVFCLLTPLWTSLHFSRRYISQGMSECPRVKVSPIDRLSVVFLNGIKYRISTRSRPSFESRRNTSCPPSGLSYSRSSLMRTQRPSRGSIPPTRSERTSSIDQLLTRIQSSTSSFNRISCLRCQWYTTWRLDMVLIR
jgi:hypothetical protein